MGQETRKYYGELDIGKNIYLVYWQEASIEKLSIVSIQRAINPIAPKLVVFHVQRARTLDTNCTMMKL